MVFGVIAIDKSIDDPIGATSAHGLAGIWGTLACGLFTAPRLAQYNAFGDPDGGLFYSGCFDAADRPGGRRGWWRSASCSGSATLTFAAIKATIGLRVSEEDEDAGLDIVEHGMYGYPEQFIPQSEIGAGIDRSGRRRTPAPAAAGDGDARTGEVTA